MVHNASLGSSLRYLYQEGSIDEDYWEQYASAPGALLPVRQGFEPPSIVQPAPISTAFANIVELGKTDMEYLAGIYSSMQGDIKAQHDTFKGLLANDEYGTRRVKTWMKNSVEPSLQHLGEVVRDYAQATYKFNKVFRIVEPNNENIKEVEVNIIQYNNYGDAVGKFFDYETAKFDVRLIAGSTMPINRWAYLKELMEMLKLGIVDDIAVLAEADIKDKEQIAKRKSQLAQMRGALVKAEEDIKDRDPNANFLFLYGDNDSMTLKNYGSDTVTIGNDLTVTGDLIVSGDTVTTNVATVEIEDPMIRLATSNAADTYDMGMYGKYVASGTK